MAPFKKIIKKLATEEFNKVNSKSTKQKKHTTDDMPKFILKEGTWRLCEQGGAAAAFNQLDKGTKGLKPGESVTTTTTGVPKGKEDEAAAGQVSDVAKGGDEAAKPVQLSKQDKVKLWQVMVQKAKKLGKSWKQLAVSDPTRANVRAALAGKALPFPDAAGGVGATAEPEAAKNPMAAKKAALAKKKEKVAAMKKQKGDEHRKSGKITHEAYAIYKALKGAGTDEAAVMKALSTNLKYGTVRDLYDTYDKVLQQKDDTDSGDLIDWLRDDGMDSVARVVKRKMMKQKQAVKESKIRKISARRTKKKRS